MNALIRTLSLVFSAGAFGGLLNSLTLWIFGRAHLTAELGVKLAPALTPAWLYPRLVWGGLWGALFLLPLWRDRPVLRGLVYSLGPTLVQLLVVFPYQAKKGMFGLALGNFTPLFVVLFNAVWGVAAALWLKAAEKP